MKYFGAWVGFSTTVIGATMIGFELGWLVGGGLWLLIFGMTPFSPTSPKGESKNG